MDDKRYCPILNDYTIQYECGEMQAQIASRESSSDGLGAPIRPLNVLLAHEEECLACPYHFLEARK